MMRMVDYPNIYYQQYMPDLACLYKCTEWSVCLSHLEGCVILVHTRQTETIGWGPQKKSGVDCTNEWYLGGVFVYILAAILSCVCRNCIKLVRIIESI